MPVFQSLHGRKSPPKPSDNEYKQIWPLDFSTVFICRFHQSWINPSPETPSLERLSVLYPLPFLSIIELLWPFFLYILFSSLNSVMDRLFRRTDVTLARSDVKPYLGLRAKISLAWVAYPIVILAFICFRLFYGINSIHTFANDFLADFNRSCMSVESATSTIVSLPHYTADGVNRLTVDGVNFVMADAEQVLTLAVDGLENILIYFIDNYKNTLKCLLTLAIGGTLNTLTAATQNIQGQLNVNLGAIQKNILGDIVSVNNIINGILSSAGISTALLGGLQPVSLANVDSLSNVQIPINLYPALQTLNMTFSNMTDIDSTIDSYISIPFSLLKSQINQSITPTFLNISIMPVPAKDELTFCQNGVNITGVVNDVADALVNAAQVGIGIIIAVIVILTLANAIYAYAQHRWHLHMIRLVERSGCVQNGDYEQILQIYTHPIFYWIVGSRQPNRTSRNWHLLRWFMDFIFYPPAMVCLALGLLGLVAIYSQLAVIAVLREDATTRMIAAVDFMTADITTNVNAKMDNASLWYANQVNSIVSTTEQGVNNDLFSWVNITTTTLNGTLNQFVDDITLFINTAFGGTPLVGPAQDVVNCILMTKIRGIEKGLTWIQSNAHIALPRVSNTVLELNPARTQEILMDALAPLVGSQTTSNNTNITIAGGMIGSILDKYASSLQAELPFYWTMIGAWGVVFVMGVIGVIWLAYQTSPIVSAEDMTKKPMESSSELQELEKIEGKIDSPSGFSWSMWSPATLFKQNSTKSPAMAMEMADVGTTTRDSNKSLYNIPTIVASDYDSHAPHDEYYHASPVNYTVPHEPMAPPRAWAHNTQRYRPEVAFAGEPEMAQAGSVATNSVSPSSNKQRREPPNVPTEAPVQRNGSSLLNNARSMLSRASNNSTSNNTANQSNTRGAIRENIQEVWVPTAVMHTQQVPHNVYDADPFADPAPVVSSSGPQRSQKYVPLEEEVRVARSTITGGADSTNQPLKKANSNRTMHSDEYSLFTRDFKDEPTQQSTSKAPYSAANPASFWQPSAQRDSTPTSLASSNEVDRMAGSTSSGEWSLKAKADSPTAGHDPAFSAQMSTNPFDDPAPLASSTTDTRGVRRTDSETSTPKNAKSLGISIDTIVSTSHSNTDSYPPNRFGDDGEIDDESEGDHPDDSSSLSSWRFASSQPTSLTTSPTSPTGPSTPVRMTPFSGMDPRR